jgi:anti-sigma-K factor RskA
MAAAESNQEIEELAGEFVLGTLAGQERADAVFRLRTDPEFKRAVEAWERRLSPLAARVEPIDPPAGLEDRLIWLITGRRERTDGGEVFELQRRLRLWQSASLAAAAAIALLLIPLFSLLPRDAAIAPTANRYVAVLQPEGQGPAFIATIDLARGIVAAQRVGAVSESGKSFELWAVGAGREKPQSLGVVDGSLKFPVEKLGRTSSEALQDTILAISIEPKGGSPTGVVTGPIVYTGRLIPAE